MKFQKGDRVVVKYDRWGRVLDDPTSVWGDKPWEVYGNQGVVTAAINHGMMSVKFDGSNMAVDVYTIRFEHGYPDTTCRGAREL